MHSLDVDLVRAAAESNVGLICRKQTNSPYFYIYLAAPLGRPDELEVEALLADLSTGDGDTSRDEVSEEMRTAFYRAVLPAGR